jgi:hypothetical protein
MRTLSERYGWRIDTLKGSVHHSYVDFPGLFVAPWIGRKIRYVGVLPPDELLHQAARAVVDTFTAVRAAEARKE